MGSIPAPAGEPDGVVARGLVDEVYPRACGGTSLSLCSLSLSSGLSPRLRGNPALPVRWSGPPGSIPAPAGEPQAAPVGTHRTGVYPRACGGTRDRTILCTPVKGLSPRLRGNPGYRTIGYGHRGSIPAPAGEPYSPPKTEALGRVYPRACGGTRVKRSAKRSAKGLSPRLRGNLGKARRRIGNFGSIPAPAGEPTSGSP